MQCDRSLSFRFSKRQLGMSAAFANDSEALKSPGIFLEEKRKSRMVSVAQQAALGSHGKDREDTEDIDQETPAKGRPLGSGHGETPNHGFLVLLSWIHF